MGTLADLRGLRGRPWYVVAVLVAVALVVLVVRAAALAVFVVADVADRIEVTVCAAAGIAPVTGAVLVAPAPAPGGWTPGGQDL